MSTYEFSAAELGLPAASKQERHILTYEDILYGKVPIDEIRAYMVSPDDINRLKDDVVSHLFIKIEKIAAMGLYTEVEIEQMYENSREVISDYEQIDPATIDQVTLIDLIQKARSFHKELQELQHGKPNRLLEPSINVAERIRQYTEPRD